MSHAGIESVLITQCCSRERKDWKIWLSKKNGEYDKRQAELLELWITGGWFYKLMFTKPEKNNTEMKNIAFRWNEIKYEEAIERIEDLEALANKSSDGIVMLTTDDARFLNIDHERTQDDV